MTFRVGQIVNFTLVPPPESRMTHTFTVSELGINEYVKYGKPTTFTYTFDRPGTFRLINILELGEGGTGAMMGAVVVK